MTEATDHVDAWHKASGANGLCNALAVHFDIAKELARHAKDGVNLLRNLEFHARAAERNFIFAVKAHAELEPVYIHVVANNLHLEHMFALRDFLCLHLDFAIRVPIFTLRCLDDIGDFLAINEELDSDIFRSGRHVQNERIFRSNLVIDRVFYPFAIFGVAESIALRLVGRINLHDVHFIFAVSAALVFAIVIVEGFIVAAHVVIFRFNLARDCRCDFLERGLRNSSLFAFHVPIVEIETALLDNKEQVFNACSITQVEGIFLPARACRDVHRCKRCTCFGLGVEFNLTAITSRANDDAISAIAHIHGANLCIEIRAHVGEVDVIALLCHMLDDGVSTALVDVDATDPRLRFGFNARERVKVLNRLLDAIIRRLDGRNRTVSIPGKFFNRSRTAIATATHVLLVVIEEEATALEVNETGMVCERSPVALIHDDAAPLPRTRRRITCRI